MTEDNHKLVALLRGVNVGGANRVPMADLCDSLSAAGFGAVRSYIASGNLVFDAPAAPDLEGRASDTIEAAFGIRIDVRVVAAKAFRAAVHRCPFEDGGNKVHGVFCWHAPQIDLAVVDTLKAADETLHLDGDILWVHAPSGIGRSKLMAGIDRVVGGRCTVRNLNTLRKLAAMAEGAN